MSGAFSAIDLSRLAAPSVVEVLDFEAIFQSMLADLIARESSFSALVESDPAFKILQVCAYRELLIRQRVNDAAKAVMLAFAAGPDLDHIGANYGAERLLITPADDTTIPPTPAVYEEDSDYRARIQLSPEAYTTAGSEGSYVYHALSADGDVKDAQAVSPSPGAVVVYVLSRSGTGLASPELLSAVSEALNDVDVRPMTDQVTVQSAAVTEYQITAELKIYLGPDSSVVLQAAIGAVTEYAEGLRKIGYDIPRSGIYAALHQPGVQSVTITSPAADIVLGDGAAGYCSAINITTAAASNV